MFSQLMLPKVSFAHRVLRCLGQLAGCHGGRMCDCSEAQAQAACDLRNSRYNKRLQVVVDELQQASEAAGSISPSSSLPDRLNQV